MTIWTRSFASVIPVEYVDDANKLAKAIDPDKGGEMSFSVEATDTEGSETTTHMICYTPTYDIVVSQIQYLLFLSDNETFSVVSDIYDQRFPEEEKPTLQNVVNFKSNVQVFYDTSFEEVLSSTGLFKTYFPEEYFIEVVRENPTNSR